MKQPFKPGHELIYEGDYATILFIKDGQAYLLIENLVMGVKEEKYIALAELEKAAQII